MLHVRPVLSAITTLVGPIALMILGAAIALALIGGGESGPDDPAGPKRQGRATVVNDGVTVHATLDIAVADTSTALVVHGPGGEALARFVVGRSRLFSFEATALDPIGFVIRRGMDRSVQMGLANGRSLFDFHALGDGSASIDIYSKDLPDKPSIGLGTDPGGVVYPRYPAVIRGPGRDCPTARCERLVYWGEVTCEPERAKNFMTRSHEGWPGRRRPSRSRATRKRSRARRASGRRPQGLFASVAAARSPSTSLRLVNRSGLKRASNRQGTRMLGSFPLPRKSRLLVQRARRTPAMARP